MTEIFSRLIKRSFGWAEVAHPVLPSRFAPLVERTPEVRLDTALNRVPAMEAGLSGFGEPDVSPASQAAVVPSSLEYSRERDPASIVEPMIRKIAVQSSLRDISDVDPGRKSDDRDRDRFRGFRSTEHQEQTKKGTEETGLPPTADQPDFGSEIQEKASTSSLPRNPSGPVYSDKSEDSQTTSSRVKAIRARIASHSMPIYKTGEKNADQPSSILGGESVAGPPVIKVHIGRIEVRAVTPLSTSPKKETGTVRPRLTLEDYLSRRERGRT